MFYWEHLRVELKFFLINEKLILTVWKGNVHNEWPANFRFFRHNISWICREINVFRRTEIQLPHNVWKSYFFHICWWIYNWNTCSLKKKFPWNSLRKNKSSTFEHNNSRSIKLPIFTVAFNYLFTITTVLKRSEKISQ